MARIHPTARIGPGVIVGARASIGEASLILGNASIAPDVRIGSHCVIFPGVVLYPRTIVGDRARILASNSTDLENDTVVRERPDTGEATA